MFTMLVIKLWVVRVVSGPLKFAFPSHPLIVRDPAGRRKDGLRRDEFG